MTPTLSRCVTVLRRKSRINQPIKSDFFLNYVYLNIENQTPDSLLAHIKLLLASSSMPRFTIVYANRGLFINYAILSDELAGNNATVQPWVMFLNWQGRANVKFINSTWLVGGLFLIGRQFTRSGHGRLKVT